MMPNTLYIAASPAGKVEMVASIPAGMVVVIITLKVARAAVDAALKLVKLLMQKPKPSLKIKQHIYLN
jgi:hypothetical protein